MRKIIRPVAIVLFIIIVGFMLASLFGFLRFYKNATTANEPNLKYEKSFLASSLISPKINDLVIVKVNDTFSKVSRLCGMENDKIEIKNGVLYLNDKNFDEKLNLIHHYLVPKKEYNNIVADENIEVTMPMIQGDSMSVYVSDKNIVHSNAIRIIDSKEKTDSYIEKKFNNKWNKDNFGPIKIPKDKIFLLGDNRDNSEDSRYLGFFNKSDITGVVIKY